MEKKKKKNCASEDCPDCQARETVKAVLEKIMEDPDSDLVNAKDVKFDRTAVDLKPDGSKFYGKYPHYWKIESPDGKTALKVKFKGPNGIEGMWVTVAIGNEYEGFGYLDSEPVYTPDLDVGDIVLYIKDEDDADLVRALPISWMIKADPKFAYATVKQMGALARDCLHGK